MLVGWMLFTLVLSGLVAVSVRLWEDVRIARGKSLRWGWVAGALGVPALALLPTVVPSGWPESVARVLVPWLRGWGAGGAGGEGRTPAVGVGETVLLDTSAAGRSPLWFEALPAWISGLSPWLAGLWAVCSMALLAGFLLRYAGLRRARRRWPRQVVAGKEVLVSDQVGPGVLGLLRGETVLPRWCLELDASDQALVVAHEEEHRAGWDPLLLAASRFMALLLPWNVPLWWMDRRLRVAVEVDCDARVTARWPETRRRYAELLLTTAALPAPRRRASPLALLVEPSTPLHRRIVMLTHATPRPSRRRVLASGLGALVVLVFALLLPGPDLRAMGGGANPDPAAPGLAVSGLAVSGDAESDPATLAELRTIPADTPTFTPFTVAPQVQNRADVGRALEQEYPSELREAGIGGTVLVFFYLNDEGGVERVRLHESSGFAALDEAGLRVAETFEFSPAFNRDQRVPVWIQIPITFTTREGSTAAPLPAPPTDTAEVEGPRFTPFTVAPEVLNRAEVVQALQSEYPEALREAGIGGTALLYFFIDQEGVVSDVRMHERSGHAALDEAALRVARVFRFSPAMNRDQAVPVWIQIPLTFTTR